MKLPDRLDRPPTFTARYGGWCTAGGDELVAGDEVVHDGDGYSHVECYVGGDVGDAPVEVCDRCRMTKPCWCDE